VPGDADAALVATVQAFLAQPRPAREGHRLGKGKLHDVYRLEHEGQPLVIKVRGRESLTVRVHNYLKGLQHLAATGERTRLQEARVRDRWEHERRCTEGWQALGFETVRYLPFPDPSVRVMHDTQLPTLAMVLRDPEVPVPEKHLALKDVASFMFIRHQRIRAAGLLHLFHEEPHTGNVFYEPGRAIFFDQEFLPDPARPAEHHAAAELVALAQSAVRDLGYTEVEAAIQAQVSGYPDHHIVLLAARLLEARRARRRWSPRRRPVTASQLARCFHLASIRLRRPERGP
jgi:hypothetical protein